MQLLSQAVENTLIAQEVTSIISKKKFYKRDLMGIKLDLQKAYDKMEWTFLIHIMRFMGSFE